MARAWAGVIAEVLIACPAPVATAKGGKESAELGLRPEALNRAL